MENTVQRKARLILAGLAALPAIAMASGNVNQVQSNSYTDPEKETLEDLSDLQETTGLSKQELAEGKTLVHELNQLDVITVKEINLTKAPRIPYMYNMPLPAEVDAARVQNLERLAKLRNIIEAAK